MYNRYVPQPDGSFQRNRLQDAVQEPTVNAPAESRWTPPPSTGPQPPRSAGSNRHHRRPPPPPPPQKSPCQESGPLSFFRQLLPKDFCTEDLLVVILLLLMSGDCKEDQNMALLTLALYLFL